MYEKYSNKTKTMNDVSDCINAWILTTNLDQVETYDLLRSYIPVYFTAIDNDEKNNFVNKSNNKTPMTYKFRNQECKYQLFMLLTRERCQQEFKKIYEDEGGRDLYGIDLFNPSFIIENRKRLLDAGFIQLEKLKNVKPYSLTGVTYK
jgi:hypothetical protein